MPPDTPIAVSRLRRSHSEPDQTKNRSDGPGLSYTHEI